MKGVIFNLLEQCVDDEFGEDTWDRMLDRARVDGAYTAVGTYPHEELHRLVDAASEMVSMEHDEIVRWFGRRSLPILAERYSKFFSGHDSAIPFILTLNEVIHPEVRKLFPGAYAPSFAFEVLDEGTLALSYRSNRDLCGFGEGLIAGAADHYGETVEISQTKCTRRGDEECVFLCRFSRAVM